MNTYGKYKEMDVLDLENANKLIAKDWMLITARDGEIIEYLPINLSIPIPTVAHKRIIFEQPLRHSPRE